MCVKKDADGIVSYNINCDFANYGLAVHQPVGVGGVGQDGFLSVWCDRKLIDLRWVWVTRKMV